MIPLTLLPGRTDATRVGRDRLELLTALIDAPGFDPVFRDALISIPPQHPVYAWQCAVEGCERIRRVSHNLCNTHNLEWEQAERTGRTKRAFMDAATALPVARGVDYGRCLICSDRPAVSPTTRLCQQHRPGGSTARQPAWTAASSSAGPAPSTRCCGAPTGVVQEHAEFVLDPVHDFEVLPGYLEMALTGVELLRGPDLGRPFVCLCTGRRRPLRRLCWGQVEHVLELPGLCGQQLVPAEPLGLDPRAQVFALQRHLPGGRGQRGAGLDEVAAQLVAALPGDRPGRAP
ncbi:hypothetical protein ACFXJ5_36220 [Streptomyces sp. NPDC059373]